MARAKKMEGKCHCIAHALPQHGMCQASGTSVAMRSEIISMWNFCCFRIVILSQNWHARTLYCAVRFHKTMFPLVFYFVSGQHAIADADKDSGGLI
jgi:hypothetical protein